MDPSASDLYACGMGKPDRTKLIAWLIGGGALGAWFAMLWFMFSDVL